MSTQAQQVECDYLEGDATVRQEQQERGKQWSWKGLAFAISLRKTKVTKTIEKAPSYGRNEPYQPVRIMAMAPTPPSPTGSASPDPGLTGTESAEGTTLIIQMGPLDLMPPNNSDGPHVP